MCYKVSSYIKGSLANYARYLFADEAEARTKRAELIATLPSSYEVTFEVVEDPDSEIEARLRRIERLTLLAAKNVFSVDDLALYLGKSPKTIKNNADKLPHYYDGNGQLTFRRSEIEAWQCSVKHTPITQL